MLLEDILPPFPVENVGTRAKVAIVKVGCFFDFFLRHYDTLQVSLEKDLKPEKAHLFVKSAPAFKV